MFTPLFSVADPHHPLPGLHRQLDAFLSDWARPTGFRFRSRARAKGATAAAIDILDGGGSYRLVADVPGLGSEDFEIEVTEEGLTLRGERKVVAPEGYTAHRREREAFRLARSFTFPTKIDPQRVEAKLDRGVLTITLAKRAETKPRSITVRSAD